MALIAHQPEPELQTLIAHASLLDPVSYEFYDTLLDKMEPKMYKANSGGIRFQLRALNPDISAEVHLSSITNPQSNLFVIVIYPDKVKIEGPDEMCEETSLDYNVNGFKEFWFTWFNGVMQFGIKRQAPIITSTVNIGHLVGFVRFMQGPFEWIFEESPVILRPIARRKIEGGELRWVSMSSEDLLPFDAMVGGFEKEPIYIARANFNGHLCPGKYVPSSKCVYVPWGGSAHEYRHFEVLCGFDGEWLPTYGSYIPHNAVIGGTSEVRDEPLYIGRALHDGCLINGKIHLLYNTCYLPYDNKEVEKGVFEVLVHPQVESRGIYPIDV